MRGHCKEELRQKPNFKKNVPAVAVDEGVSKMMCQLLKQRSAPDIDIDVFSGNPMDFHYFIAIFNEIVEKKVDDTRGKLTRLIKYTTGDAKEMAKNCIQLPAEIAFETAKRMHARDMVTLTESYQTIERKSNIGPKSKPLILMHIKNSRTSWLSLKNLVIFRVGKCWIHLTLCACYCQSCQALLEANDLEMP